MARNWYVWGVPLLYVLFGAVWVIFADELLHRLVIGEQLATRFHLIGQWAFLIISTLLLLLVLNREWHLRQQGEDRYHEASRMLDAFVNASPLALIILDRDGRIRRWNPAAERIFGWNEADMIGLPPPFIPLEAMDDFMLNYQRVMAGESIDGIERVGVRRNGKELNAKLYLVPLRNPGGEIDSAIALIADVSEQKTAETRVQKQFDRLAALRRIDMAISGSLDLTVTLEIFIDQLIALLQVDAAAVLMMNPHNQSLEYRHIRGIRGQWLPRIVRFGDQNAGRVARDRVRLVIPELSKQFMENPHEPSEVELEVLKQGFVSYVGVPLMAKGQVRGVLEVYFRQQQSHDADWLEFLDILGRQAAIAIDNATLFDELQRTNAELIGSYDATIEGWAQALDLRDRETQGHTERVTRMTVNLARSMGVKDADLAHIRRGALLHDIGKLGVPDTILHKKGPLSDDEWKQMRRHPVYAYEMLSRIAYLRQALDIPYCHHESWDGTGYPRGLREDQIPLAARIFTVVDVYDALVTPRPYHEAISEDQAIMYIHEKSGVQFDQAVVNVFERLRLLDRL